MVDNVFPICLGVACAAALHLLGLVLACCLARCLRRAGREQVGMSLKTQIGTILYNFPSPFRTKTITPSAREGALRGLKTAAETSRISRWSK